MDLLEVKFRQGEGSVCMVYSAMTTESPIVSTLSSSTCNGHVYCSPTDTDTQNRPAGTNGFYKIHNAMDYGLGTDDAYILVTNNPVFQAPQIVDSESIGQLQPRTLALRAMPTAQISSAASTLNNASSPWNILVSIANTMIENIQEAKIQSITRSFNVPHNAYEYKLLKRYMLTAFNRFNIPMVDSKLHKAFPRVFFTRPDINLFGNDGANVGKNEFNVPNALGGDIANDTWFHQTYNTDPLLLASLTDEFSTKHHFNPFLSNASSSFNIDDEKLETMEHGETYTGWKMKYGRHNIATKSAGNFSITYSETNTASVYKIHKAWVDYIAKVYRGEIKAKDKYIRDRRLDYACSVYYIVCAEDGETILFWSKYVGVFPTTIPASEFTWNKGDVITHPEVTIEYDYSWKEDNDYASLIDFNYNACAGGLVDADGALTAVPDSISNDALSIYDPELGRTGFTYANVPFIHISKDADDRYVLKLKYSGMPKN